MKINYHDIEKLIKLEKKIKKKEKVEFGDQDIIEFNRIVESYKPFDISQLIEYTLEIRNDFELWENEHLDRLQEELRETKRGFRKKLEEIARLIKPYLPKEEV